MPDCPCSLMFGGGRSYHCARFDCKMFPHFCQMVVDDVRFRVLYEQGRGPTQPISMTVERKGGSVVKDKSTKRSTKQSKTKRSQGCGKRENIEVYNREDRRFAIRLCRQCLSYNQKEDLCLFQPEGMCNRFRVMVKIPCKKRLKNGLMGCPQRLW